MSKPTFKWPIITLLIGVYVFLAAFIDAFIDTEGDQLEAMVTVPLAAGWIVACLLIISKRIDRLDEWKDQRRLEWVVNRDLPRPEVPDWEAFERRIERELNPPPDDRRNPFMRPRMDREYR